MLRINKNIQAHGCVLFFKNKVATTHKTENIHENQTRLWFCLKFVRIVRNRFQYLWISVIIDSIKLRCDHKVQFFARRTPSFV